MATKKNFTWNYYMYYVVNLTKNKIVNETDDKEMALIMLREYNRIYKSDKFVLQQQHYISKIINTNNMPK